MKTSHSCAQKEAWVGAGKVLPQVQLEYSLEHLGFSQNLHSLFSVLWEHLLEGKALLVSFSHLAELVVGASSLNL